jgi:hypothetical protein
MKLTVEGLRQIIREELEAEERWAHLRTDPYIAAVLAAGDPRELAAAKRRYVRDDDAGMPVPSAGAFFHFHDGRAEELKRLGAGPAVRGRADAILRTRDSTGRATARRR